jgi:hypothetical protein
MKEGILAKVYAELDERLRKFIVTQPIFFVATAPRLTADVLTRRAERQTPEQLPGRPGAWRIRDSRQRATS